MGGSVKVTTSENTSSSRSGSLTVKTTSGLTKTVSIQQKSAPANLHFSANFRLNDNSVDGSGHLDYVTVIIKNSNGEDYDSFTCNSGNAGERYGSADFSENDGIDIGQISIRYSGNVDYELQPELKLNNEIIENDSGGFPILVNKTLYGENTMTLYCEFDYF